MGAAWYSPLAVARSPLEPRRRSPRTAADSLAAPAPPMPVPSPAARELRADGQRREDPTQGRTERLIAGARVILSIAALVTLWFDPTQPPRYAGTYGFLGIYVLYS